MESIKTKDQAAKQVAGNVVKCRPGTSTRCLATPRLFVLLNVTASLLINLTTCTRQAAEASSISTNTATTTTNGHHNLHQHSHKSTQTSDSNKSSSSSDNNNRYRNQQDSGNKQHNHDKSGKLASLIEQQQVTIINSQQQQQQQETFNAHQEELKVAANSATETNALIYLQKYGYMQAHSNLEANNLISEDSFSNAISSFQKFAGLPETGLVDSETLKMMQLPRCGNVDKPTIQLDAHQKLFQSNNKQINSSVGKFSSASKKGIFNSSQLKRKKRKRRRKRKKRYALQGSKWRRQELTYRISQYPTRFAGKRYEVDSQIEKAFGIWSQVAPIDFIVKKDGRVHIDIRFASGDHGDGDAFDGPGNTLAHAYFPQYGGDAHFDDQEYWTIDSYAGTNIFQVAAHELGHSLGLGHSNVREALMAPFYQKYKPNFKLHIDDVLAIQALYGEKPFLSEVPPHQTTILNMSPVQPQSTTSTTTTTTSSTTTTTGAPSTTIVKTTRYIPSGGKSKPTFFGAKPHHPTPDSPRETNDEETNGIPDLSTTLNGNGIGNGNEAEDNKPTIQPTTTSSPSSTSYPSDLCTDSTIDAITRTEDGSSYVFKGDFYWLLTSDGLAKGYPRKISQDWDNLPGSLDAALTWADGKTFFFKGNKYWRYRNKRRDLGYPKLISSGFAGIPDDIDAAFVWSGNGRTYIFKGAEYWRFDSKANPPVSSEYPRSIKIWNGVPAHLNAAFKWENNVTYFFKGSQYYRFNDKEFKVESRGRPPFPRLSAEWWFGCISSNLAQRALSSSLKENSVNSTNDNHQDIDWSFFAGLDEHQQQNQTTKIFATHISDHKPPSIETIFKDIDEASSPSSVLVNNYNNMLGKRIGFYKPNLTTTSSSAISVAKTISGLQVLLAILISTTLISFARLKRSKCFSIGNYAICSSDQNELLCFAVQNIPVSEQAKRFRVQVAMI